MRAIAIDRFGGPEELKLLDIEPPRPGAGEVLVRIGVAGVNYIDVYMRNGAYAKSDTYKTPLPMTLGMEGAGTVAALGEGVSGFEPGERVSYCLARGSYAEFAVVPAWRLVKVPQAVPLELAAALMLQGFTAHYLTHSAFVLKPGDWCLIHAGAGGVGQLAIQLAKNCGATVVATVGNARKAEIVRARGADYTILYREADFRVELMRITGGRGVDVVYDSVGRETIERSIRSLRRRGLCVMFGASSGQVEGIAPLLLAEAGSVYFTRPHLADYTSTAAEIGERAAKLFGLAAAGKLHATVHAVLNLAQAAEAHRILESRGTLGKLLLRVEN